MAVCRVVPGGETDGEAQLHFPALNWRNGGVASGSDAERWVKALAQWRTGDFSLAAVHASRTKKLPTAPYNAVFDDNRNQTTDTRAWIEGRSKGMWWSREVTYSRALKDNLTVLVGAEVQSDLCNVQHLFDTTLADPAGPEHRQDHISSTGRQFFLKLDYAFQ